jgi:hypothetical protein
VERMEASCPMHHSPLTVIFVPEVRIQDRATSCISEGGVVECRCHTGLMKHRLRDQ